MTDTPNPYDLPAIRGAAEAQARIVREIVKQREPDPAHRAAEQIHTEWPRAFAQTLAIIQQAIAAHERELREANKQLCAGLEYCEQIVMSTPLDFADAADIRRARLAFARLLHDHAKRLRAALESK